MAIDRRLGGKGALPPEVSYSLRRPTEEELEKTAPRVAEEMLPVAERRRQLPRNCPRPCARQRLRRGRPMPALRSRTEDVTSDMSELKLNVDGRALVAQQGQTILEVAEANGIPIPHLCHDPRLTPTGACRLCLVEIEGEAGLHTACTRMALPGMTVRTQTDAVRASRKNTLEFLLSEHRVACTTCDKDGDCLLQDYAYEYQASETRFPSVMTPPGQPNYTTGNKGIEYDPSKCVRCQRCVKICAEVVMAEALTLRSRALPVQVSTAFDIALNESTCELCGQCVGACPTAALYERSAEGLGRAKELVKVRTTCPYCGDGLPDGPERQPAQRPHRARHQRAGLRAERRQPVREGALRVRVRPFARAPDEAADPRERLVPRGVVGRGARARRKADARNPRAARPGRRCVPQFLPLHERGELPRAEAGARRRRHEQRGPVRDDLPRAHRRRPRAWRSAPAP